MSDYNFDAAMAEQERTDGKVDNAAVVLAKENLAKEKLMKEAREVQSRLETSDAELKEAQKNGRYASKKKNILKTYSENMATIRQNFEATGDIKAYDKAFDEAVEVKDKAIREAKKDVYGDDAWRYRD